MSCRASASGASAIRNKRGFEGCLRALPFFTLGLPVVL